MFKVKKMEGGKVVAVELDRPPANAFDLAAIAELEQVLDQIERDNRAHAILFWSAGRFFSAGADLQAMEEILPNADAPERLAELARLMQRAFDRVEEIGIPSICALSGTATGGGLELALACDIRIANADVLLGLPESKLGLVPGAGGTQRLTRIAGTAVARRLILTGELVTGEQAGRIGIVQDVAGSSAAYAMALELCRSMAEMPRHALASNKRCLHLAPFTAGFNAEIEETLACHRAPETRRLIEAFMSRRRASKRPSRPS